MTETNQVWVIDDDRSIRWVLEKALTKAGMQVTCFSNANGVIEALERGQPEAIISDVRMPGMDGFTLLEKIKQKHPDVPVIIMTAHSDLDSAVSAYHSGAFEYLPKPFDIDEAVDQAQRACKLRREARASAAHETVAATEIIGAAPAMQEVFRAIGRLARSNITVLINGESGTGKELVAHALHKHSPRANGPFIALNMAAIPRDLLESELFGHEKGAFTGAHRRHVGAFERARGGTLLLDEIGELPVELQPALLGVLERKVIRRVGGESDIPVDVRVLCATHRDLRALTNTGAFRPDLYFRIAVTRVPIPPLRQRPEDVEPLARHFTEELLGPGIPIPLDAATLESLRHHPWAGNVRELRNVIEGAIAMGGLEPLTPEPQADEPRRLASYREARALAIAEFERRYLSELIESCDGNASEAARRASMDRPYLLTLLRRHGLR